MARVSTKYVQYGPEGRDSSFGTAKSTAAKIMRQAAKKKRKPGSMLDYSSYISNVR